MKTVTSFTLNLAVAVLIVVASAPIAAAQAGSDSDTCAGAGATIGGTCAPLTNTTSGSESNTALGSGTLGANTTGGSNTATGTVALSSNTGGSDNTANGAAALLDNTTGVNNTASGEAALLSNTTGIENTAAGVFALGFNTTGNGNTATGTDALIENITGSSNTATGISALQNNTTGSFNIGIGLGAGLSLTTGDNNIDIFDPGVAGEANTIRIGTQGMQTATFIAGIFGTSKIKKACEVVVDRSGQVGCVKSSARYKRDVRDMGDASDKLMKLRPVTFRYRGDAESIEQFGLIAEEVEKVYPELVIDDASGRPETVEYQVLPAMLLNEVQKERRDSDGKSVQIARLSAQVAELKPSLRRQSAAFEERLSRIEQTVASRDGGRKIAAAFER